MEKLGELEGGENWRKLSIGTGPEMVIYYGDLEGSWPDSVLGRMGWCPCKSVRIDLGPDTWSSVAPLCPHTMK